MKRLPSGAGHDAQMLAAVCPACMIFVPSANGVSHNIEEYTEPEDLAAGANVLLRLADRAGRVMRQLICNARIVTGDGETAPFLGDVLIDDDVIVALGAVTRARPTEPVQEA